MRRCSHCKKLLPDSEFPARRTWCRNCLLDWELRRSTPKARASLIRRFDAKVDRTGDCWFWTGAKTDQGYGTIGVEGRTLYAHRVAYERWNGPLAPGVHVDHL